MFTFQSLRKRHQATPGLATFHHGDVFLPGAGNAVYEPAPPVIAAMLPIVQLIGASIIAGRAPSPYQLPQVYAHQTALIAGIGGVLAGGIYGQPLNVPETTNGNQ